MHFFQSEHLHKNSIFFSEPFIQILIENILENCKKSLYCEVKEDSFSLGFEIMLEFFFAVLFSTNHTKKNSSNKTLLIKKNFKKCTNSQDTKRFFFLYFSAAILK